MTGPREVVEALDNPTPRMLKVLVEAEEKGWTKGRVTVCIRLDKPEDDNACPFYATWEMAGWTPKGRPSWRFVSAASANLQPLSEADILTYLNDPAVIWPEGDPDGCQHNGCTKEAPLCERHKRMHTPPSKPGIPVKGSK
jgi:hypothetical protein